MLCMLFLSTLQQTESLPSEDHRETCQVGRRGWGWATCLQSLLRAPGPAPGVCVGLQVLLSPHTSVMLWAAVLMGKRYSPAGHGPATGALWLQSWRAASLAERQSRGSSGEAPRFTFLVYSGVCFCSGFWAHFLSLSRVCFALGCRQLW